jgi:ferrochelatase
MRYGKPSIEDGLRELAAAGCARVLVFPAFPQASRATTGSGEREVRRVLAGWKGAPEVEIVPPYFEDPGYVASAAALAREALAEGPVDHLVFSFHGVPERIVEAGDPYRDHCERAAGALARALGLDEGGWTLAYQSRFGRERWLGPDTARVVTEMAARAPRLLLLTPGFAADCLETLEELGIRLREQFLAGGGKELRIVPCLNEDRRWVEAAAAIVRAQR